MKRFAYPLVLALLLLAGWVPAQTPQGQLDLELTVLDSKGKPLAQTEIEFLEIHARTRILKTTDAEGKVSLVLNSGRYWQINILEIRDYYFWQLELTPGRKSNLRKTITYSYERYERETRAPVDRVALGITKETQRYTVDQKATKEMSVIKLTVLKADDGPLANYPVALTCYALKKTFEARTNPAGIATFFVPKNQEYDIDIDGIESYNFVDIGNADFYTANKRITYEPTVVDEKMVRDTIVQKLPTGAAGTSARVFATVTLRGGPDGNWANEPVYLDELGSKKVYKGVTNLNGEIEFLLPKGKAYMIHGRYERDLDVIDLRRRRGVGYANKSVRYKPSDRLQFPEKYIPTPEALFITPFDRFITQQYPGPTDGSMIRGQFEWGNKINANSKEAVLKLAFTGGQSEELARATPLNISLVIDKSGSMAGHDRMDQLKLSLQAFVDQLRPEDVVSLITFEDFETVIIPAQKVGANKERFKHAIYMLEANGGTNIFKGLMEGYQQVSKNHKPGITNRVILLTDGYGVTPPSEILAAQKPYTEKGIECSAVGVGEDYNVALLQLLATGGLIEHVGESADLQRVFTREISSLLYPVAENVEVTVEFPARLKYKQLHGYPLAEKSSNRLKLKLRNFYRGLSQLALLHFTLENPDPSLEKEPVKVKLKYRDLAQKRTVETVTEVPLEWSDQGGNLLLMMEQHDQKILAIATMNQTLKVMSDAFAAGDVPKARKALEDGLAEFEKIYPHAPDEDLKALRQEVQGYLDILANLK
jgi:Ca-activated chloride channel family protein